MDNAEQKYREMLLEPMVPTPVFHEVIEGIFYDEGTDPDTLNQINELLHHPYQGNMEWEERSQEIMRLNMISTVTEAEAMSVILDSENESPNWDVLAERVIQKRKMGADTYKAWVNRFGED